METNNYPSWLVSVEIAKKLKEIGFDLPCAFVLTNKDRLGFTTEGDGNYHTFDDLDLNSNTKGSLVCVPTFDQVFMWFREKGLIGTVVYFKENRYSFEVRDLNGHLVSSIWKTIEGYEESREKLINSLIEVYEK